MLTNDIYIDCPFIQANSSNGGPGNYTTYLCYVKHRTITSCEGCRNNYEGNRITEEMRTDPNDYREWLKRNT